MAYDAGDVEAKLTLDRDPFTEGLKLARKQVQDFTRRTYKAKLGIDIQGRTQLTALINRLNALGRRTISPKVRINNTGVLPTISNINNRLTALGNRVIRPRIVVNRQSLSGVGTVNQALNQLTRPRQVNIRANVNRNSFRTVAGMARFLTTSFSNSVSILARGLSTSGIIGAKAFKLISQGGAQAAAGAIGLSAQIGVIAAKLGLMGVIAIAVFGAITFVAGALVTILASLPALIAAIGVPVAALALGWDGVTKAAKVLEDEVESLKKTLSDTLYETMLPGFEQLQEVFPVLETGLDKVARKAGEFFTHMAEVVTTEENMRKLERVFSGVLIFMERMEGPLERIFLSFLNIASTESILSILGQTVGGLTDRISYMFDQMLRTGQLENSLRELQPLLFQLMDMFVAFSHSAMDFFIEAAPGVRELFKGIQAAVENIDFEALGRAWGSIAAAIGEIFASVPKETWQSIVTAFQELATLLKDPETQKAIVYLFKGIDDLVRVFTKVVEGIINFINWFDAADAKVVSWTESFNNFSSSMQINWGGLWDWMTKKSDDSTNHTGLTISNWLGNNKLNFDNFGAYVRGVWDGIWGWIRARTGEAADWLSNKIKALTDGFGLAFMNGVNYIKREWDRLKEIARTPVKWVVDFVYNDGIVRLWNGVAGVFGMPKLSPMQFAKGGVIPGYAPGVDSVPIPVSGGGMAMLSPGEGVLVPEAVKGLGQGFVHWANKFFSNGRVTGTGSDEGYADGGIIGTAWDKIGAIFTDPVAGIKKMFSSVLNAVVPGQGQWRDLLQKAPGKIVEAIAEKAKSFVSNIGGMAGPGGWQWMIGVLRSVFPGLGLISGYRAGSMTRTGNVSYHASGRAVDVPPRWDVFNFIRGTFGARTKELIFSPAGNAQIWNGSPHFYTEPTRGDHWDHVHWAYDNGGILPPGWTMAYNGTGKNEHVLTDEDMRGSNSGSSAMLEVLFARLMELIGSQGSGTQVTVNAAGGGGEIRKLVEAIVFAMRHANKSVRR